MRDRSKSTTSLPDHHTPLSQRQDTVTRAVQTTTQQTRHEPIPLAPVDHSGFHYEYTHTEKGSDTPITHQRMRSNSFTTTIDAFHQGKAVGRLRMTTHRNQQQVDPNDPVRIQGRSTAYVSRIDNFTFDGFNKGVPGVGKGLMNKAEGWAQALDAEKISLTPSDQTFKRQVMVEEPNTGLSSIFSKTKRVPKTETKTVSPVGFYQHVGYGKDPDQVAQKRAEATRINQMTTEYNQSKGKNEPMIDVDQYAQQRSELMSKPLFHDVQRQVVQTTLVTRPRSKSLPPPPKKPMD